MSTLYSFFLMFQLCRLSVEQLCSQRGQSEADPGRRALPWRQRMELFQLLRVGPRPAAEKKPGRIIRRELSSRHTYTVQQSHSLRRAEEHSTRSLPDARTTLYFDFAAFEDISLIFPLWSLCALSGLDYIELGWTGRLQKVGENS